jgi:hypothetical protein
MALFKLKEFQEENTVDTGFDRFEAANSTGETNKQTNYEP